MLARLRWPGLVEIGVDEDREGVWSKRVQARESEGERVCVVKRDSHFKKNEFGFTKSQIYSYLEKF